MHTMQGIARRNTEHTRATTRARHTLATTHLGTLRAHTAPMGARAWAANTLYLIDAAYGQRAAESIRDQYRAAIPTATPSADVLAASRAFWATVLPLTAADACDACEDDHASIVLADSAVVCAREGADR